MKTVLRVNFLLYTYLLHQIQKSSNSQTIRKWENLPEPVNHLVNVSDIQLVFHCLNLVFSTGPDWTVRAWPQREEIKNKNNENRAELCKALRYFRKTSQLSCQRFLPVFSLRKFRVDTVSVAAFESVVHRLWIVQTHDLLTVSDQHQHRQRSTQVSSAAAHCSYEWNYSQT